MPKADGTLVRLVQLQNPWGANPASPGEDTSNDSPNSEKENASPPSPGVTAGMSSFSSVAAEAFPTSSNSSPSGSSSSNSSSCSTRRKSKRSSKVVSCSDWARGSPNWTPEVRVAIRNALRCRDKKSNLSESTISENNHNINADDQNGKDDEDEDDDDVNRGRFWLSWEDVVRWSLQQINAYK